MVRGSFNKGKLNGNIGWLKFNNGSGFIGFDAIYVNGLIDNYESKDTTDHFTPNQLYYYSGKFRNGMKNGYGELICRKPNYIVFEGEWPRGRNCTYADVQCTSEMFECVGNMFQPFETVDF